MKAIWKVTANGTEYSNRSFNKFGVFVQQTDLLLASLTVKESIMFSTEIKVRGTKGFKQLKVQQMIKELGLQQCQNLLIGNPLVGVRT